MWNSNVMGIPNRYSLHCHRVIDILIIGAFFNSYSLQYYSFWKGKIGFGFLKHEDWFLFLGQRQCQSQALQFDS